MDATTTQKVRRELRNFYAIVHRVETRQVTGRNAAATERAACAAFERALREVVAIEDAHGVEAAGEFGDRLTTLRQRAMAAGLMTAGDLSSIERQVLAI